MERECGRLLLSIDGLLFSFTLVSIFFCVGFYWLVLVSNSDVGV